MKLSRALRIENGRCANVAVTVERLESALGGVYEYEYVEQRVCESLYWGACHVAGLGFPPMGKGDSSPKCKASTLAETVEWLALRRRRALPGHTRASQSDVPDALPVEDLLSHVASVTPSLLGRIKETESAQHWVDGYSLIDDRSLKVPLEYVNCISGTNGVAAGNCLEEAVVQGAFEVLERRGVITAIRNRMRIPTIDPSTIVDPVVRQQIDFLERHGTELTVKDLSFGGALPCVGVHFVNHNIQAGFQAHNVFKGAASFDRRASLSSCLAEYAQVCHLGQSDRHEVQAYERLLCDGDTADNFLPLFWFGYVPYETADFLAEGENVSFDAGGMAGDCLADVEWIKGFFKRLGLNMVVVDLTDPALGFPAVQVVVPGYSDILPYHPASSPVMLRGWTRDLKMGSYRDGDVLKDCTAAELFPGW